jgi:starch synthase
MASSKKYKILFVTSEVLPFMKTGGLADVSSALTQKLTEMGHQVRIVVPKYGAIDERKYKIHEVVRLKDLKTNIGDKEVSFSLRSSFLVGSKARVQIYFLDNQEYFVSRHSLYEDPLTGDEFKDNDERFILLNKCIFELITKLGWIPDIIHVNDWQCSLIPAYLKTIYKNNEVFKQIKTILTIHNIVNQGIFPKSAFAKTGLPEQLNSDKGIMQGNKVNFLKAGILHADIINTVSNTHAKEIVTDKDLGYGLHDILGKRKKDIFGIINGIDESIWNPEKDKLIAKNYSVKNFADKFENKKALCENFDFVAEDKVPVIGIISKLI